MSRSCGPTSTRRCRAEFVDTGHADALEEAPVVRDEDQRSVEGAQRALELLDRGQVEVVRRLVEHEAADARAPPAARARPRPLAGRERLAPAAARGRRRGRTWRAACALHPRAATTPRRRCGSAARPSRKASAPVRSRRRRPTGPTRRVPLSSGTRPSSASISVVLPLPFGPAIESRSPHWTPKSSGPSRNGAALDDRILQRDDEIAGAPGRSEIEPQLPRLPGLLDAVALEPLDPPRRRAGLRHQRMRAAPVRLLPTDTGLLAAVAVQLAEACSLVAPLRERALVLGPSPFPGRLVLGPAARVLVHAVGAGLELQDPIHGAIEELAVVRDDDEAAVEPQQEALEQLEAVEVEVVRRLVQQVDVEAREQDRGQCGATLLAAGKLADAPVEPASSPRGAERQPRAPRTRRSPPPRCAAPGTRAGSRPAERPAPAGDSRRASRADSWSPSRGRAPPGPRARAGASSCRGRSGRRRRSGCRA